METSSFITAFLFNRNWCCASDGFFIRRLFTIAVKAEPVQTKNVSFDFHGHDRQENPSIVDYYF